MSREELLNEKRFSRWLAALLLAFAALGGVACEATVEDDNGGGDVEVEDGEGEGEGEGDVDTDVDVDTDEEGGEEEGDE